MNKLILCIAIFICSCIVISDVSSQTVDCVDTGHIQCKNLDNNIYAIWYDRIPNYNCDIIIPDASWVHWNIKCDTLKTGYIPYGFKSGICDTVYIKSSTDMTIFSRIVYFSEHWTRNPKTYNTNILYIPGPSVDGNCYEQVKLDK